MTETAKGSLHKILGLGFGLALAFGGTVGVGILRLPGTLAGALGDSRLIIACWIVGGLYALLGAVAVAELSAMYPQSGGFYVYAQRAFGNGAGFVVGWSDWINNVASLSYAAITAAVFLGVLWTPAAAHPQVISISTLVAFTALHWLGLRIGSTSTRIISVTVGLMFMVLVVGCFLAPAAPALAPAAAAAVNVEGTSVLASAASLPLFSLGMLTALVTALRAVLVTYDGWYSPIYLAEENKDPATTMPRAIVGGTLLVAALYIVLNMAFLRVLPLSVLAHSELPAADAARIILPRGGAELVTVISLLTVLSLVNAVMLMTPRILLAIGRDGFFTQKAATVSAGGTPRVALMLSSLASAILILCGTFNQIIALAAVLFLLNYVSAYSAMFVLRRREPLTVRPYRAFGFPYTTGIVLLGSVLFLVAAVVDDYQSGMVAAALLVACVPIYLWLARRRGITRA